MSREPTAIHRAARLLEATIVTSARSSAALIWWHSGHLGFNKWLFEQPWLCVNLKLCASSPLTPGITRPVGSQICCSPKSVFSSSVSPLTPVREDPGRLAVSERVGGVNWHQPPCHFQSHCNPPLSAVGCLVWTWADLCEMLEVDFCHVTTWRDVLTRRWTGATKVSHAPKASVCMHTYIGRVLYVYVCVF